MPPRKPTRQTKQPVQRLRLKLLVLAGLYALPLFGALSMLVRHVSFIPTYFYVGMSVLTFFLYRRDKQQAGSAGWRTPEKVLHGAELLGGWPGALIAQQVFRHKTRKVSYQALFWLIVLLHELFWIDRLFMGGRFLARHLY